MTMSGVHYHEGDLKMNPSDHELLAGLPKLSDEEKQRRTLAGLADVDAGRTIPHEEVLRSLDQAKQRSTVRPKV